MQMNMALQVDHRNQAEQLRRKYFPNTTPKETRDSFIFDFCVASFQADPKELLPFIENDEISEKVQRMITLKTSTNARLRTISGSIGKPIAATLRAIIAWSIFHIDDESAQEVKPVSNAGVLQLVCEKIQLMETQEAALQRTLGEIKELLAEARK